jgi:alpha-1,6-mannosyltransferase
MSAALRRMTESHATSLPASPVLDEPTTGGAETANRFAVRSWLRGLSWQEVLGALLVLLMLAATAEIVLDSAVGRSPVNPKAPSIAGYLSGLGTRLGYRTFLIALLVDIGAYGGLLALRHHLRPRVVIGLVVVMNLLIFAGPVLLSQDVFSYIAYARMGVEHGLSPYTHGPIAIHTDSVFRYVGLDWRHTETAYGPLYTLLSYPLAPLGLVAALWGVKLEALIASAGTLALVWRCARLRGVDPGLALIIVGLNPLYLIYGLGGAHNDLILMLAIMAAVALALDGRDLPAGGAIVAGTLIKATGIVLLPFLLLHRRRLGALLGGVVAVVVIDLIGLAVFGSHSLNPIAALNRDAALVSTDSFPNEIAHLLGKRGVFPVDHTILKVLLVLVALHLMWRTWRGYDWIAASGWALVLIAVTSTWLLAWYALWALPLAAISRDRRLLFGVFAVQAMFVVHQLDPLLAQVK